MLVFDAVDCGLPGGTLKVLRGDEVPVWGAQRISPHQNGFNDVLALAQIGGRAPDHITAIGVQPITLDDFGGSLRPAGQGAPARGRGAGGAGAHRLGVCARAARARQCLRAARIDRSLSLEAYEAGRPSADEACRVADPRVLALSGRAGPGVLTCASAHR